MAAKKKTLRKSTKKLAMKVLAAALLLVVGIGYYVYRTYPPFVYDQLFKGFGLQQASVNEVAIQIGNNAPGVQLQNGPITSAIYDPKTGLVTVSFERVGSLSNDWIGIYFDKKSPSTSINDPNYVDWKWLNDSKTEPTGYTFYGTDVMGVQTKNLTVRKVSTVTFQRSIGEFANGGTFDVRYFTLGKVSGTKSIKNGSWNWTKKGQMNVVPGALISEASPKPSTVPPSPVPVTPNPTPGSTTIPAPTPTPEVIVIPDTNACIDVSNKLAGQYPLRASSTGVSYNWGGAYEKWFQDKNGQQYYMLLSESALANGYVNPVDSATKPNFNNLVTRVYKWNNGLSKSQVQPPAVSMQKDQEIVSMAGASCFMAVQPGYTFPAYTVCSDASTLIGSNPAAAGYGTVADSSFNWGGIQEKWIKGTNGVWYYAFPNSAPRIAPKAMFDITNMKGGAGQVGTQQLGDYQLFKWNNGLKIGGRNTTGDTYLGAISKDCYNVMSPGFVLPKANPKINNGTPGLPR